MFSIFIPRRWFLERYLCTLLISIRIRRYEQHPTNPFSSHVFIRTLDMYTQDNLGHGLKRQCEIIRIKTKSKTPTNVMLYTSPDKIIKKHEENKRGWMRRNASNEDMRYLFFR
jgi:hypothetical protein